MPTSETIQLITPVYEEPQTQAPAMALLVNVGGHQYKVDLAEIYEQVSAGHKAANGLTAQDRSLLMSLMPLALGGTWESVFDDEELETLQVFQARGLTDSFCRYGATVWGITKRGRDALTEVR